MNDEAEFINELYNRWFFDIVRYCKALLAGDEVLAVDCAHAVFDAARDNEKKLINHPNILGWLMLTAKHRAMRLRRNALLKNSRETNIDDLTERYEEALSYIQNYDISIDENKIEDKKTEILRTLSVDEKSMYDMYYTDRMKQKDIAKKLGISPDAVRMRLVRIKRKLTDALMQRS